MPGMNKGSRFQAGIPGADAGLTRSVFMTNGQRVMDHRQRVEGVWQLEMDRFPPSPTCQSPTRSTPNLHATDFGSTQSTGPPSPFNGIAVHHAAPVFQTGGDLRQQVKVLAHRQRSRGEIEPHQLPANARAAALSKTLVRSAP